MSVLLSIAELLNSLGTPLHHSLSHTPKSRAIAIDAASGAKSAWLAQRALSTSLAPGERVKTSGRPRAEPFVSDDMDPIKQETTTTTTRTMKRTRTRTRTRKRTSTTAAARARATAGARHPTLASRRATPESRTVSGKCQATRAALGVNLGCTTCLTRLVQYGLTCSLRHELLV